MSLQSFKRFVSNNPHLIDYVSNKEKTWQEFYEMYELYGDNEDVWNRYLKGRNSTTIKDLFSMFKDIDVSEIQESIMSIQKGLGYIGDIFKEKE